MRTLAAMGLGVVLGALAGCGGEMPKAADTAPFVTALEDYLRAGMMEMKVEKIESIEVAGDRATAKARMATKENLYGMKPLWTVTFARAGDVWKVAAVER